jgi:hypothetical protein
LNNARSTVSHEPAKEGVAVDVAVDVAAAEVAAEAITGAAEDEMTADATLAPYMHPP